MEVIEPGRPKREWSHDYTCTGRCHGGRGCGARLRVTREDLFVRKAYCGDQLKRFVSFRCCECGTLTDIPGYLDRLEELPDRRTWEGKLS